MTRSSDLTRTDDVQTYDELVLTICWDDDEDPEAALQSGVYTVCGGEWRREQDNEWRFWEDPIVAEEMRALSREPSSGAASPQPREGEWQKISDKLADALRHFNAVIADEGGFASRKAMLTRQMASEALDAYLALVADQQTRSTDG